MKKIINRFQYRLDQIGTIAANALDEWKHGCGESSDVYGRLVGIRSLARKGTTAADTWEPLNERP